jgi:glycine/D-amino acid oxidase-like deaminating enzyme
VDLKSGHPYWLVRDGLLGVYPPLTSYIRCDVAVIGGGISGALAAWELTRRGFHCVLLDKRDFGQGSTCASTSLLLYETDTHLTDLMAKRLPGLAVQSWHSGRRAVAEFNDLVRHLKCRQTCGFRQKDSLYLASTAKDIKTLREEFQTRMSAGFEVHWLDRSDLRSKYRLHGPAGILSSEAAEVDAYCLTHVLIRDAVANGLQAFDRTSAEQIETSARSVRIKTSRGTAIHARWVVFATGYESQRYLSETIARTRTTFALASEPLTNQPSIPDLPHVWETARPYIYLRTTSDHRIIAGGKDEAYRNVESRQSTLDAKAKSISRDIRKLFPHIKLEAAYTWAGAFAETRDGLPRIGTVRQWPRCFFALGYGGNGITFSFIAARLAANWIEKKPDPDARLYAFD